jgi:hypothetical protein
MTYIHAKKIITDIHKIKDYEKSYTYLCKLISTLLIGTTAQQGMLEENLELFRVLPFKEGTKKVQDFSYPPSAITKINRCNLNNKPVFYASFGADTAIFEKKIDYKCEIVLTKWIISKRFLSYNLFWYKSDIDCKLNEADILINDFIKKAFETDITTRSDIYYLTNAITHNLIGNKIIVTEELKKALRMNKEDEDAIFVGVRYPSVANYKKAENIAILPEYVDKHIKLIQLYKIELNPIDVEKVSINITDVGRVDESGIIKWAGNTQTWEMPGEQKSVTIRVNENGFIEPTEKTILLPKVLKFDIRHSS